MLRTRLGSLPEGARAALCGPRLSERGAGAALGLDGEGYLLYAELGGVDPRALLPHMQRAGVERAMAVQGLVSVVEARTVSVDGRRPTAVDESRAVGLLAETRPAADVMFPEVEPMPYRNWGWLQGQRVRYFPQGEPRFRAPEDVAEVH
jgi:hypothetical protein